MSEVSLSRRNPTQPTGVPVTGHRGKRRVVEWQRPWLYPEQEAAIFTETRYSIIEASTKSGKTAGCMIWLLEQAMKGAPGQQCWWVAPIVAQAKIVFRRLKRGLPAGIYTKNESELTITLGNGVTISCKSADNPDSLYGEDVLAAVMDEASRTKEEAWHAVRSTLTHTRGKLRVIGNVKGRKNWAYALARKAESGGDSSMEYHKITAYQAVQAGILDSEEIEDARTKLPENVFNELYLAIPSEDEGNPFGEAAINRIISPMHDSCPPVCWGWDLAKSVDWTVGIAFCQHGYVCKFHRFRKPWTETMQTIMKEVGERTPALIDSTGVGDPIVEALQRKDTDPGKPMPAWSNVEGLKFTQQSKQQLMEGLAVAIQQERIHVPQGPIVIELMAFEYEYTKTGVHYTAPSGYDDDCVMALALAVRKFLGTRGYAEDWTSLAGPRKETSAHTAGVRSRGF